MPKVFPGYKEGAKSRIIEVAAEVFSKKGYHEATMEDVADRIGIGKGTVYLYFASKEELFREMCKTGAAFLRETLRSSFTEGGILESSKSFFEKALKDERESLGFQLEFLAEATRNPTIRKIHRESYREILDVLTSFIEEKKKENLVRPGVDSRSLALDLIAMFDGLKMSLVAGLGEPEVKSAWEEFVSAILFGVLRNQDPTRAA